MKKSMFKAVVVAAGLMAAMQAYAIEPRWELGLGYDGGGDELTTVQVNSNLTGTSSQTVRVGQGAAFAVGAAFANDEAKQFETVATVGFKTGGPRADNGKATFTSMPLTLMQFFRPNDLRLGLGATYNIGPEFTQKLANSNIDASYDDAMGVVAQVGWAPVAQRYSVDLRYTSIKYQLKSAKFNGASLNVNNVAKADGSSVGIYGSVRF
jgi:hypothetical protein